MLILILILIIFDFEFDFDHLFIYLLILWWIKKGQSLEDLITISSSNKTYHFLMVKKNNILVMELESKKNKLYIYF